MGKRITISEADTIYKVAINAGGGPTYILVFCGENYITMRDAFLEDPTSDQFTDIFTEKEIENIFDMAAGEQRIPIFFVRSWIYKDDTIDTLKRKLLSVIYKATASDADTMIATTVVETPTELSELVAHSERASYEQIYMFTLNEETIDSRTLYQQLTEGLETRIEQTIFNQALDNILDVKLDDTIEPKEAYQYDDILALGLDKRPHIVKTQFGQAVSPQYQRLVSANPYNLIQLPNIVRRNIGSIISTQNRALIMEYPAFIGNTIYCCFAEDTLTTMEDAEFGLIDVADVERAINIYYPFLAKNPFMGGMEIRSLASLRTRQLELRANSMRLLNEASYLRTQENIELLRAVHREKTRAIPIIAAGIAKIELTFTQSTRVTFPLETIFRLIHATREMPFIKYNPGPRREKNYRLYTDGVAKNGKKIPHLKKATITFLSKNVATKTSVAYYIQKSEDAPAVIVEIFRDGSVGVATEYKGAPMSIPRVEEHLREAVVPILEQIREYMQQSGYKIDLFDSLQQEGVHIRSISYQQMVSLKRNIIVSKYLPCMSSVFSVISDNLNERPIEMRYKRVSYYNEAAGVDAFILDKLREVGDTRDPRIVSVVMSNFGLDEASAKTAILKILDNLRIQETAGRKRIRVLNNPGLQVIISKVPFSTDAMIRVDGIDNLEYIDTVEPFIDAILRITQGTEEDAYTAVSRRKIQAVCEDRARIGIGIGADVMIEDKDNALTLSEAELKQAEDVIEGVGMGAGDEEMGVAAAVALGEVPEIDEELSEEEQRELMADLGDLDFGEELEGVEDEAPEPSTPSPSPIRQTVQRPPTQQQAVSGEEEFKEAEAEEMAGEDVEEKQEEEKEEEEEDLPDIDDLVFGEELGEVEDEAEPQEEVAIPEQISAEKIEEAEVEEPVEEEVEEEEQAEPAEPAEPVVEDAEEPDAGDESESLDDFDFGEELGGGAKLKVVGQTSQPAVSRVAVDSDESLERDIVGMPLKNPTKTKQTPFFSRMKKLDPVLFLTKKEGKYNAYSRLCPSNVRRQPVIITDAEKEKIDREHPGAYSHAIRYGSTPDKQNWYICPRYWCLKNNTALTAEDVAAGKCGGKIIPFGATKVPKDAFIYEFSHPEEHFDESGNYLPHIPGFIKGDKHPDGLCLPCCFKGAWNANKQRQSREQCGVNDEGIGERGAMADAAAAARAVSASSEEEESARISETASIADQAAQLEADGEQAPDADIAPVAATATAPQTRIIRVPPRVNVNFILTPERFPMESGRWGKLPLEVQAFLQTDNAKCQRGRMPSTIKPDTDCLLRKGVENSRNQSFLACVADLLHTERRLPRQPTIADTRSIIAAAVTLDFYISYFQGSLIRTFLPKGVDIDTDSTVNLLPYLGDGEHASTSTIMTRLNVEDIIVRGGADLDEYQRRKARFARMIVASYENFQRYLKNPESTINHTYLWDIVCTPNPRLFPSGINLAILEIPADDVTGKVELLCPTSAYSTQIYNERRGTWILMKRGDFYEPIYIYRNERGGIVPKKLFYEATEYPVANIALVLRMIKTGFTKCAPLPSRPRIYKMRRPLSVEALMPLIASAGLSIREQVVNYNGQVIGVFVDDIAYVPVFPSAIQPASVIAKTSQMDAPDLWSNYETTVAGLRRISEMSAGRIPCRPQFYVMEDSAVVGIITESNQFVPIAEPEDPASIEIDETIQPLEGRNYLFADTELQGSPDGAVDRQREETSQKIKLESNFYAAYRNTVRVLLNDTENVGIRKQIEELVEAETSYVNKLRRLRDLVTELTEGAVEFTEYSPATLRQMSRINTCITADMRTCSERPFCLVGDVEGASAAASASASACKLVIPTKNLVSQQNNELLYIARIADEILRYGLIRSFLLNPKSFLSLDPVDYNLTENEIILLDTTLATYADDIEREDSNAYIGYRGAEWVTPAESVPYTNVIDLKEQPRLTIQQKRPLVIRDECIVKDGTTRGVRGYWGEVFGRTFKEMVYNQTPQCSFGPLLRIIKEETGKEYTLTDIKRVLAAEYRAMVASRGGEFARRLYSMLRSEGKALLTNPLYTGEAKIEDVVVTDDYYATLTDYRVMVEKLRIPVYLLTGTITHERDSKIVALLPGRDVKTYYFIRVSAPDTNKIQEFSLVKRDERAKIEDVNLSDQMREIVEKMERSDTGIIETITEFRVIIPRGIIKLPERIKKVKEIKEPVVPAPAPAPAPSPAPSPAPEIVYEAPKPKRTINLKRPIIRIGAPQPQSMAPALPEAPSSV